MGFFYFVLALLGAEQQKQYGSQAQFFTSYSNVRMQTVRTEVIKYYNTHGRLPDTLAQVSATCETNDFFGRPILYKTTGANTAELSSLGRDGKVGGSGADEDTGIVLTVPTP